MNLAAFVDILEFQASSLRLKVGFLHIAAVGYNTASLGGAIQAVSLQLVHGNVLGR